MNCPRCPEVALEQRHQANMEVDHCPNCGGVWLDQGEDEALTRPDEQPLPAEVIAKVAALAVHRGIDTSPPLTCPRCSTQMVREHYATSDVEIDRCTCGVWLDEGELEKITVYRNKTLEKLAAAGKAAEGHGAPEVDLHFSPQVLERSFARIYFDLGRSEAP